MIALYTAKQIRQCETAHATAKPKASLMQGAGEAVAKLAMKMLAKRNVLILAGTGNNGGDAWVAARTLQKQKINVTVVALGEQKNPDPAAKKALAEFSKANGKIVTLSTAHTRSNTPPILEFENSYGLIIDGIFGTGLSAEFGKKPSAIFAETIRAANTLSAKHGIPILAIDIPSGLVADTGVALDEAIHATTTLTFLGAKPGLYTADGGDYCGEILIDTLGMTLPEANGALLSEPDCAALIPVRRRNSHKGSFGNVGIIGGADGMVGAAVIAARAALHMGPGKVYMGLMLKDGAKNVVAFDAINPEIMVRAAADLVADSAITAFAIGMGIGAGKNAKSIVNTAIANGKPLLLDADALQFLKLLPASNKKQNTSIGEALRAKMAENAHPERCLPKNTILTPHPGEAARLLNITTSEVQRDRIGAALKIAERSGAVVVLKGAGTVIATPSDHKNSGRYFINPTGNPGMASGGMGDALSGMIAAFMAQGLSTLDAAKLGVYLHGAAADAACHHGMGPHGLTASEVIFEARSLLNSRLADFHD